MTLATFNCKNIVSSAGYVRRLCTQALQGTWLLPHYVPFLGRLYVDYGYTGN